MCFSGSDYEWIVAVSRAWFDETTSQQNRTKDNINIYNRMASLIKRITSLWKLVVWWHCPWALTATKVTRIQFEQVYRNYTQIRQSTMAESSYGGVSMQTIGILYLQCTYQFGHLVQVTEEIKAKIRYRTEQAIIDHPFPHQIGI